MVSILVLHSYVCMFIVLIVIMHPMKFVCYVVGCTEVYVMRILYTMHEQSVQCAYNIILYIR